MQRGQIAAPRTDHLRHVLPADVGMAGVEAKLHTVRADAVDELQHVLRRCVGHGRVARLLQMAIVERVFQIDHNVELLRQRQKLVEPADVPVVDARPEAAVRHAVQIQHRMEDQLAAAEDGAGLHRPLIDFIR